MMKPLENVLFVEGDGKIAKKKENKGAVVKTKK